MDDRDEFWAFDEQWDRKNEYFEFEVGEDEWFDDED